MIEDIGKKLCHKQTIIVFVLLLPKKPRKVLFVCVKKEEIKELKKVKKKIKKKKI